MNFMSKEELLPLLFAHPQKVESLEKMKRNESDVTLQSKGSGGVKWWKRKTIAHFEDYYQTPKQIFESRSIDFVVEI